VLRSRDAPSLRLTFDDRDRERSDAYAMVGRTLRNLALHQPDALAQAIADEFAWTGYLPEADRAEFVGEFTRVVVAAAELDNFAALGQLLNEWRSTAEIHSDPNLAGRLTGAVTAAGAAVELPVG